MKRFLLTGLLAFTLAGCAAQAGVYPDSYGYRQHGYRAAPHVPPGHLPPPGSCRIWHPDRPPGHQPPPGPCHSLRYHVPPGASLIRG